MTKTSYKLSRMVDGEYYWYGTYDDPERLAEAAFFLGQTGAENIMIVPIEKVELQ